MQFQISARKWRPQTFEEVLGQETLILILTHAVSEGKIAQAYLFSGMRGVGKTTVARILAKALNCADPSKRPCNACVSCREITEDRAVDVMQIDGASNTSVDNVRELREIVKYRPLQGKYKVVIIDEAHMLSNAAFNALLKTLEEPPPHLVFILATTEAHKIPETIISRCQQFIFRRISRVAIEAHLKKVAQAMDAPISDAVLTSIAKASEGSLRDALSLLDQAMAYGGAEITEAALAKLFGRVTGTVLRGFIRGIREKNVERLLDLARDIEEGGYDLRQFLLDEVEYLRHLLVMTHVTHAAALIDLPDEEQKELQQEASLFSKEELHRLFTLFVDLQEDIRNAPRPHLLLEVVLMRATLLTDIKPIEDIIEQIQILTNPTTTLHTSDLTPTHAGYGQQADRRDLFVASPRSDLSKEVPSNTGRLRDIVLPEKKSAPLFSSPPSVTGLTPLLEKTGSDALLSSTEKKEENRLRTDPMETPRNEQEIWLKLLQGVKTKRPPLASYLEQGQGVDIHEKMIKIRFPEETSFLISLIQKEENQTWLSSLAKEYFNREIRVVCVPVGNSTIDDKNKTADSRHSSLVQEVLNVFEGAVIKGET